MLFCICYYMIHISIHAPPRGATEFPPREEESDDISIHAPPRGATSLLRAICIWTSFQFTPLREGRPFAVLITLVAQGYFNSRPSARGDRNASQHWKAG